MVISFTILAVFILSQAPTATAPVGDQTNPDSTTEQENNKNPEPNTSEPISNANSRVTKKPFGIYITPQNSPVSPERFSGYHNAVDFEVTESEQDQPIEVYALCNGELLVKQTVNGYGGLLIQSCELNGESVTVLYGHVDLASVSKQIGSVIESGETLALLGSGYSTETGGERKHLHLGIHKGTSIAYSGYVSTESQLSDWIDVMTVLP